MVLNLLVLQQCEGLRIVHAGMDEVNVAERMDVLWGQTSLALKMRVSASPEGLTTVTDALSGKAHKPSPGLEEVNVLTGDPRFAAGVPPAPLSRDAAYTGLVLPMHGDMRAGRDDDALPPAQPTMMTDCPRLW